MCVTQTKLVEQLTKNVFVFLVAFALHYQQVESLFFPVTVFVFVIVFLFVIHLYLYLNKYNAEQQTHSELKVALSGCHLLNQTYVPVNTNPSSTYPTQY